MWFGLLTLATALTISVSAAYYAILGLTAIFASAFWPIVILGSSLEVGKIVSTLWLHKYWYRAEIMYKAYLCTAVAILMLLTSMGVFGFLSKAHSDQGMVSGDVTAKIAIYDEKIKQARDNIATARGALQQMDAQVDQVMNRSNDERGAERAVQIRRNQTPERTRLLREIDTEQKKIQELNNERAPIAAEVRKVEAEVGPIKYIAALIYGDNPEANVLERAVRWVIILIVVVFDPLALTLLLAATKTLEWERGVNIFAPAGRRHNEPKDKEDPELKKWFNDLRKKSQDMDAGIYQAPEEPNPYQNVQPDAEHWYDHVDEPKSTKKNSILAGLDTIWSNAKKLVVKDTEAEHAPISSNVQQQIERDEEEKEARRRWKEANPQDTIHHQERLYEAGKISRLPWHQSDLIADNVPKGHQGEVKGFGIAFPDNSVKGDMFLRVDQLPSALYKYNGANWIEVDKSLSDQHAYDDAYINHLIEKISSGEYDPDLLSDAERDQIEKKLSKK